jgi:hypothetical protein
MARSSFVILASLFGGGNHSWISTRSSKSNPGGERERERGPLQRRSMQSHLHTVQNNRFLTYEPEQIDVDLNGKASKKAQFGSDSGFVLGSRRCGVQTRVPEKAPHVGGEGLRLSLQFSKTTSKKSPNRETFKANLQIEIEPPSRYVEDEHGCAFHSRTDVHEAVSPNST